MQLGKFEKIIVGLILAAIAIYSSYLAIYSLKDIVVTILDIVLIIAFILGVLNSEKSWIFNVLKLYEIAYNSEEYEAVGLPAPDQFKQFAYNKQWFGDPNDPSKRLCYVYEELAHGYNHYVLRPIREGSLENDENPMYWHLFDSNEALAPPQVRRMIKRYILGEGSLEQQLENLEKKVPKPLHTSIIPGLGAAPTK